MSEAERTAWDDRYSTGDYRPRTEPSGFLEEWLPEVLSGASNAPGRALDLATGAGRHALRLAQAGFEVDAVDVSQVALGLAKETATARGLDVNWIRADLDDYQPDSGYRLITVFRYRNPTLWPFLAEALDAGGWLLIEHHLRTTARVDGPRDEEFRVAPGELLDAFVGALRIVHYSERIEPGDRPNTVHAVVRFAACRGGPGW